MILNLRSSIAAPILIAAAALAAWIAAPPARADLVGLVIQLEKDAFGTPPDAQREKKQLRFPVVSNELLETDSASKILIEFLDETTLTMGENASLRIDTMIYDPKAAKVTMVVELTLGAFRYVSGLVGQDNVRILTPSTHIGIRGSDAMIVVASDGATTISVFSGAFTVTPRVGVSTVTGAAITAIASQAVSVSAAGVVGAVEPGPSEPPAAVSIQVDQREPGFGLDASVSTEPSGGQSGGRRPSLTSPPMRIMVPSVPRIPSSSGYH